MECDVIVDNQAIWLLMFEKYLINDKLKGKVGNEKRNQHSIDKNDHRTGFAWKKKHC